MTHRLCPADATTMSEVLEAILPHLRPSTAALVRAVALPLDGTQASSHSVAAVRALQRRASRKALDYAVLGGALRDAAYLRAAGAPGSAVYAQRTAGRLAAVDAALASVLLA